MVAERFRLSDLTAVCLAGLFGFAPRGGRRSYRAPRWIEQSTEPLKQKIRFRRAREFRIKLSKRREWSQTRMLMHICTSYEVFHPLSLPSTNLIFSFRSEGGERSSVGAKTSFSTMAARRAKHAKNEFVVQMPAKLLFMNLFLKTSPVVVAALIDIFRSLKVTICHFITMNLCLLREMRREKTGNSIYPLHWPDKTINAARFMI